MSNHTAATMSTPLQGILDQLQACPDRATVTEPVPTLTRSRAYEGTHHVARRRGSLRALVVRAARRIAHEWRKPRSWTTRAGELIAQILIDRLDRPQLEKAAAVAERVLDVLEAGPARRAYARARARHTQQREKMQATEQWWARRSGDYPILIPTQPLTVIATKDQ